MKTYEILQGENLCAAQVSVADNFWLRFRGLMLRKSLAPGEGLLLRDCPAIHCCFMRFPIDVVYLDQEMTVTGVETVCPWHLGGQFPGTKHVLELELGRGSDLQVGMQLRLKECEAQ